MDIQSQINTLSERVRRHNHDGSETVKISPINFTTATGSGVTAVTNDVNVTGSITGGTLTLGWSNDLSVTRGGTGLGTLTANAVLLGAGNGNVTFASATTAGYVLTDGGVGVNPTFQAPAPLTPVPNWVDEGSVTWAAETTDKTLTLVNSGKDIYQVFLHFIAPQAIISIQVSGKTSANYDYTLFNPSTNTLSATSSSQTSAQIFNTAGGSSQDALGVMMISPGTGTNGMSWTCRFNAGIQYADRGDFSAANTTLTSIKFLINGQTLTGKVHVYSLNL